MSTQGLVTVTHNGIVTHKIIVGCNGYNADALTQAIKVARKPLTIGACFELAIDVGFGCSDCLVIMDEYSSCVTGDDLPERYRRTFKDPTFNPRWENGTAAYVRVIECEPLK